MTTGAQITRRHGDTIAAEIRRLTKPSEIEVAYLEQLRKERK